jgi:hypothetical protein
MKTAQNANAAPFKGLVEKGFVGTARPHARNATSDANIFHQGHCANGGITEGSLRARRFANTATKRRIGVRMAKNQYENIGVKKEKVALRAALADVAAR